MQPCVVLAQTDIPEVCYLRYSVFQSYRTSAYPGETVVFSCLVYGTRLIWFLNNPNDSIHSFSSNDKSGTGFSIQKTVSGLDDGLTEYNFTGVLDYFSMPTSDDLLPLCQSTMAITPNGNDSSVEFDVMCCTENEDTDRVYESLRFNISNAQERCTRAGKLYSYNYRLYSAKSDGFS